MKAERRKYLDSKAYLALAKQNKSSGEVLQRIDERLESVYGEEELREMGNLEESIEKAQRTMILSEVLGDVQKFSELLSERREGPKTKLQELNDLKKIRAFAKDKYGAKHF